MNFWLRPCSWVLVVAGCGHVVVHDWPQFPKCTENRLSLYELSLILTTLSCITGPSGICVVVLYRSTRVVAVHELLLVAVDADIEHRRAAPNVRTSVLLLLPPYRAASRLLRLYAAL